MPPKKAYESYESESDGDSQPQKKKSQSKRQRLDKNCDEYRNRRERNNVAVRKSREASRQKARDTMEKVNRLRDENKALEQKVTILNKELGVLRDLFLSHASATATANNQSTADAGSKDDSVSENNEVKIEMNQGTVDLEPEYFVQDHRYFVKKSDNSS